jgi:hypothetical protein
LQVNNNIITAVPAGGFPNYMYSFNNGAYQPGNTFTGYLPGRDTISIRDAIGCTATSHVTTLAASAITVGGDTTVCYGAKRMIRALAKGGTQPYGYSLNGVDYQSSRNFAVPAGTYAITVKDTNNNTFVTNSITITQPATGNSLAYTPTNVSCHGGNDGSITVQGAGGYLGYTYNINGGVFAGTNVFNGLTAGTYRVSARDTMGCIAATSILVKEPLAPCSSFTTPSAPNSTTAEMKGVLIVKVFPNPASIEFNLEVVSGDSKNIVELRVMDMLGKTVYQTRGSVFDMYRFGRTFAGGMYIAEVFNGKNVQRVKLVKGN